RRPQESAAVERERLPLNSSHLESHHGIVKEILALELLRREEIRLARKFVQKLVTRDLGLAVHAPVLAFHGRHQGQQAIWPPLQLPQRFGRCVETAVMTSPRVVRA